MSSPADFSDLYERVLQNVRSAKVEDQILTVVQKTFEKALAADNLLLSRAEKKRLLAQVLKSILEDMRQQLGD